MLDRIGDDVARATSFVRFAPESAFPHHMHGGGEEIYVIDGAFEDENGVHAAGAYLRDPIGSSHGPSSRQGCTLFVKLWQFDKDDKERLEIETALGQWRKAPEGFAIQPLHYFAGITTFLVRLDPGATFEPDHSPGRRRNCCSGRILRRCAGSYPAGALVRDPGGHRQDLFSAQDARFS